MALLREAGRLQVQMLATLAALESVVSAVEQRAAQREAEKDAEAPTRD